MTARSTRYVSLDIARGMAILGTLATNIWIFSHPAGMLGYLSSPTTPGAPEWQQAVEAVAQQLANGKFLGLLTLMFGIGLAIQAESAARRGHAWPGSYLWRAAILFLDGLLHYLLVVEFDVLMGYAVTGVVVAYVLARSERVQAIWFWSALTVHALMVGAVTAVLLFADDAAPARPSGENPYRDGSWLDLVVLRIDAAALFRLEPVFISALGIAMFLLGNRLYHAGVLTPEGRSLRRRLIVVGVAALPIDLALDLASPDWFVATRYGTAPLVALGLFALIVHGTWNGRSWFGRRLGEVGRVALSAYVAQNLAASALFYGWGLDLGAMDPQWRLSITVAAWFGICAAIMLCAHLWLRSCRRGPVEWATVRLYEAVAGTSRTEAEATPSAGAGASAARGG